MQDKTGGLVAVNTKYVKVPEEDIKNFTNELKYYILSVVVPLNLLFLMFLAFPGMYKGVVLIAVALDIIIYMTKVKPTIDDVKTGHYIKRTGVLREVKFNISFEKFEYRLDEEPTIYSSITSKHNVFLEHAVEIVVAENSHRIIKMTQA